jgi:hypothetical protein
VHEHHCQGGGALGGAQHSLDLCGVGKEGQHTGERVC